MHVFVTGATGVFGRRIVQQLADGGHDVVGLNRDEAGERTVERTGGEPVRGDVLERATLETAVEGRAFDVVVHAATRLPPATKTTAEYWERNDRVRLEGARNLLATLGDDVERFVFPSVVWVARQPDGSSFDEESPRHPDRATQSAADVEDRLQTAATEYGFDPLVLRTGLFYGADDHMTGQFAEQLVAGDLPVIGGGILGRRDAELSLVHVEDAASGVRHAIEAELAGCYHVVDEEPVTVADYLGYFADVLDAPEPSRVPWWLARPFAGKDAVRFMTSPMPTSNEKFRAATDWEPTYETYRDGLPEVVETWREDGTMAEFHGGDDDQSDDTAAGTVA